MTTLVIILTAAAAGFGVATWFRIPPAPLLLLMGLALGGADAMGDPHIVQQMLLLGVTFLVFYVSTELNAERAQAYRAAAIWIVVSKVILLGGVGVLAALALQFAWQAALYIALAISASSSLMVMGLLRQRRQTQTPFGRLITGVLLFESLLVMMLLPVVVRIDQGGQAVLLAGGGVLAMTAAAGVFLRWLSPWLLTRISLDEEGELLAIVAILFLFVGGAFWLGLPIVTGAFFAGLALSAFPVAGVVRSQVNSLANFFLCVFFICLGASVQWPTLRQLLLEVSLLSVLLLALPLVLAVLIRRAGLTMRSSIEGAALLSQTGELSIVIILVGVSYGHVGPNALAAIILVTALTVMLTPMLASERLSWRVMGWLTHRHGEPVGERMNGHVLLLGCSRKLWPVVSRLKAAGYDVIAVDQDPATVKWLAAKQVKAVRGDGADYHLLRRLRARDARAVVSSMRTAHDHERVLRFVGGRCPVLVRVFAAEEAHGLAELGGQAIVESDAAAEAFLAWFDHWHEGRASGEASRIVNATETAE